MTPEGRVKAEVKKQLKALGAYQLWPVQNGMGAATVDCIACIKGLFYAIETKAPGKKPTPRQMATLTKIAEADGFNIVIDSVDMAKLLPQLLGHHEHIAVKREPRDYPSGWSGPCWGDTGPTA